MDKKLKYRIWCETEATYVYTWSNTVPTECPNNAGHAITAASICSMDECNSRVILTNILENAADAPQFTRLANFLDKYPVFVFALNCQAVEAASGRVMIAQGAGDLQQSDVDLINSYLP